LVQVLVLLVAIVGILFAVRVALVLALAGHQFRLTRRRPRGPDYIPPVAIVVPAYNESIGIERAVRSLAASDYPDFEIVVVDDGSTDDTAQIVEGLALERVRLLRKLNGGKASA